MITREHLWAAVERAVAALRVDLQDELNDVGYTTDALDFELGVDEVVVDTVTSEGVHVTLGLACTPVPVVAVTDA